MNSIQHEALKAAAGSIHIQKKPVRAYRLLVICGETGIRTLEGLPPTRFPGVRLKPLGHLSVPTAKRKGCKSTEFLSAIPKFLRVD